MDATTSNGNGPTDGPRDAAGSDAGSRSPLIFCGMCGALNPAANHFCAACGTTLVDAFHGTEGLRVYERPDTASRLIEIVRAGSELDVLDDPAAPADFVRIRLAQGKLGYVRLLDLDLPETAERRLRPLSAPDINCNARGCVTPTAALASLALLIVFATMGYLILGRSGTAGKDILPLAFCLVVAPLILLTIAFYLFARGREERLEAEAAEAMTTETAK